MLRQLAIAVLLCVVCAAGSAAAVKAGQGEDLPADAPLRVGVKHRPDSCERKSEKGDSLEMHYTGRLFKDGEEFDSSLDRGPFKFTLGAGMVIKGWDEGLTNMCEGEKRKLTIPASKGYGDRGAGAKIPGGATLVFDVELLKIHRKGDAPAGDL